MQDDAVNGEKVDLNNCDREAIHIPNLIQAHGVMLVFDVIELTILQVSENIQSFLGYHPQEVLGQPLASLLSDLSIKSIRECLAEDFNHVNPLKISFGEGDNIQYFDGIIHRYQELIIFELEPTPDPNYVNFVNFYNLVNSCVAKLQNAD